jgi:thioredoxin 1
MKTATDNNFEESVLKSEKLTIVFFQADWCGPCRLMIPILEEIENEYKDKIYVFQIDVDYNARTTNECGVRNIPAILFFENEKRVEQQIGAVSKKVIIDKINNLI